MTLQTWLKGLLVFVISAFITSLAAVNISPSTFSFFTEDGLKKLGLLVLVIGVKAVVLYLKQSPLPIGGAGAAGSGLLGTLGHSFLLALLLVSLVVTPVVFLTGCSSAQFVAGVQDIESKLPEIAQIATGIYLEVDPEYAPAVQPFVSGLQTAGQVLVDAVQAYKASPSPQELQQINAALQKAIADVNGLAQIPGIKDPHTQAIIHLAAGSFGLIFNDIASWVQSVNTPAVTSQLPAVFGWHIAGVDLVAIDGNTLPAPAKGKVQHSGYSARDIALQWNKACHNEKAKIHAARKHVLGIPIPGTGHN